MSDIGWETQDLREIARITMGQSPPSETVSEASESSGTPFLQGNAEFGDPFPHSKYTCSHPLRICTIGDTLISVRAPVGASNKADQTYCIGRGLASITFHAINPSYGWHYVRRAASGLMSVAQGTTFEAIGKRELGSLRVSFPAFAEQPRIAEVLDTIDEAIRSTERLIVKLEQAKQGLIHDLLTRGIHETGRLRDPDRDPDQFKESPLGLLPKSWEVRDLGLACSLVTDCPHTTPIFRDEGILVARTTNIRDGRFILEGASYVDEQEYRERISRAEPQCGDLIFTREAPVGQAFVVPPGMRICLGQRVMLLRPNLSVLNSGYLLSQIYSGFVSARISVLTAGTTNPHLNVGEVRKFLIPVPTISEQEDIARIVSNLEGKIYVLSAELRKYRLLKQGLMDDLLTGRVRVGASA